MLFGRIGILIQIYYLVWKSNVKDAYNVLFEKLRKLNPIKSQCREFEDFCDPRLLNPMFTGSVLREIINRVLSLILSCSM